MTGVYSSTIRGLAEKNSQGLQRLFQTPSFDSQGPFIVQQLYLQIHMTPKAGGSLPCANHPQNDGAVTPLGSPQVSLDAGFAEPQSLRLSLVPQSA